MTHIVVQALVAVLLAALVASGKGPGSDLSIETFLVGGRDSTAASDEIGGWKVRAVGRQLRGKDAEAFVAVLESIVDYNRENPHEDTRCLFTPYVGFRFERDGRPQEIIVCFSCNELEVDGPLLGFTPEHRAHLLALSRIAFPDDTRLRQLPPN
jgi:hypothetical protein